MRGPIILFGSTQQNRQLHACEIVSKELDQKINWSYLENFPDIKIVAPLEDKKSISIAQIREATHFLQERPLALQTKIVVVSKANELTTEAQNSFLKTLEEPPTYALILLLSKTEGALLPTVLSRSRKIKTFDKFSDKAGAVEVKKELTLHYVLALDKGARLDWAEEHAKEDKDTIIDILESWLEEGRKVLLGPLTNLTAKNLLATQLEQIKETLEDLEYTNVALRLSLEKLLVNF